MFCEHCGSPLEEGARFCTNCGMPVEPLPGGPAGPAGNPIEYGGTPETHIGGTFVYNASPEAQPAQMKGRMLSGRDEEAAAFFSEGEELPPSESFAAAKTGLPEAAAGPEAFPEEDLPEEPGIPQDAAFEAVPEPVFGAFFPEAAPAREEPFSPESGAAEETFEEPEIPAEPEVFPEAALSAAPETFRKEELPAIELPEEPEIPAEPEIFPETGSPAEPEQIPGAEDAAFSPEGFAAAQPEAAPEPKKESSFYGGRPVQVQNYGGAAAPAQDPGSQPPGGAAAPEQPYGAPGGPMYGNPQGQSYGGQAYGGQMYGGPAYGNPQGQQPYGGPAYGGQEGRYSGGPAYGNPQGQPYGGPVQGGPQGQYYGGPAYGGQMYGRPAQGSPQGQPYGGNPAQGQAYGGRPYGAPGGAAGQIRPGSAPRKADGPDIKFRKNTLDAGGKSTREDIREVPYGEPKKKTGLTIALCVLIALLLAAIIWEGITLYRINHTDDDFRAPALTEESAQTEEETEAAEEADEDTEEDKKD